MNNLNQCKVGQFHSGSGDNQSEISQQKVVFYKQSSWWWGLFWGFVLGIPSSYIASWLWSIS